MRYLNQRAQKEAVLYACVESDVMIAGKTM
jgi:hypothetical protein